VGGELGNGVSNSGNHFIDPFNAWCGMKGWYAALPSGQMIKIN
jgi:hypothetical protein